MSRTKPFIPRIPSPRTQAHPASPPRIAPVMSRLSARPESEPSRYPLILAPATPEAEAYTTQELQALVSQNLVSARPCVYMCVCLFGVCVCVCVFVCCVCSCMVSVFVYACVRVCTCNPFPPSHPNPTPTPHTHTHPHTPTHTHKHNNTHTHTHTNNTQDVLTAKMYEHGALLFRGFKTALSTARKFEEVV